MASVPLTLRQEGFVPMSVAECKRTRNYVVQAKRALSAADCADEADKSARLATLSTGISILRKAKRRSPPGFHIGEMEEVAAALSMADPHYVCAVEFGTPVTSDDGNVYNPFVPQPIWSDATVNTKTPMCCADWSVYGSKCCFAACFDMSVLFPALLSLDYCCKLQQNQCEQTYSCPSQVIYAVAP